MKLYTHIDELSNKYLFDKIPLGIVEYTDYFPKNNEYKKEQKLWKKAGKS